MKILGIDYGTKKMGIALSDQSATFAFPHSIISAESAIKIIKEICQENEVTKIILGQPLGYKGDPTEILEKIEGFKSVLEEKIGLPVVYESEVLTTKQAERPFMKKPVASSKKNVIKVKRVDASAAALTLQSFLDRK